MSSRARRVGGHWFDTGKNARKATVFQIELLASALDISIDDLLDKQLNQGEIVVALREALGEDRIPSEIEERRLRDREERKRERPCRICGRKGDSTRHHFVNRWILRILSNYHLVGDRRICTIPVCTKDHRDLHSRENGPLSIARHLDERERQFVREHIERLRREHQGLFDMLADGDPAVYEACLVQDWLDGKFDV